MDTLRNAYWDNLKAVLIFLVVFGHFLLPVSSEGEIIQTVYYWIYIFHMPAMVFVSGVFSKGYIKKEKKINKLIGFFILYLGFTCCIVLIDIIAHHEFSIGKILNSFLIQSGAPWYLLAMVFWYMAIPYFSQVRPIIAFFVPILLALTVGYIRECGDFLVLSRTIVFFPFFLAGYYYKANYQLSKYFWARIGGLCFLLISFCLLLFFRMQLSGLLKLIYANSSYVKLGISNGVLSRIIWYIWASCMVFALMCIIPRKRLLFTYIGERTLGIFMFHRLIRDAFRGLGIYHFLGTNAILLISCVLISVVVVFLTSVKPISTFLNKVFNFRLFMNLQENSTHN